MENYTHWFYLESYTFLFYSKNQYVIYNTLNSTYIDCSLYGKTINTVLSILHNTNKTYCVGIYEYQLRDSQFTEFIKKIRNTLDLNQNLDFLNKRSLHGDEIVHFLPVNCILLSLDY